LTSDAAVTGTTTKRRERLASSGTLADLLFPFLGRGWSKTAMVELIGRYSNPDEWGHLSDTTQVMASSVSDTLTDESEFTPAGERRPWPVVKRLGERAVQELLVDRRSGTKQRELALRYGISESTVKRLLRHYSV
jgi:hypothetical protein